MQCIECDVMRKIQAASFIHSSLHSLLVLRVWDRGGLGGLSQHALGERQGTTLHRSPVYHRMNTQRCTLCEKKSERGSLLTLCVFSRVWSHKPRHKCPAWYLNPPRSPKTKKLTLTASSFHSLPSLCLSLTITERQYLSPTSYSSVV